MSQSLVAKFIASLAIPSGRSDANESGNTGTLAISPILKFRVGHKNNRISTEIFELKKAIKLINSEFLREKAIGPFPSNIESPEEYLIER